MPVVERVGSSHSNSRADPVARNVAPQSFERDGLSGGTVRTLPQPYADPGVGDEVSRSFER